MLAALALSQAVSACAPKQQEGICSCRTEPISVEARVH